MLMKAKDAVESIANDLKFSKPLTEIIYREDYGDYQVIIDDNLHCEIRERLIEEYIKTKHVDIRKEIFFRLEHAVEFEEWEQPESSKQSQGGGDYRGDVVVDDSANYDL